MAKDTSACSSSLSRRVAHNSIVIEFASEHTLLPGILRACCDFVAQDSGKPTATLEIVLRELLSNAVEHGNHSVRSRRVRCELVRRGNAGVFIRVSDEGKGFAHQDLDLSAPQVPGCRLHRGLVLVKAFCEELTFNAVGNEISVGMTWDDTADSEQIC